MVSTDVHHLQPGVYQLLNFVSGTAMDLCGSDLKSIIGFPAHDGLNQQWEFSPLGQGYSIRSMHSEKYLTVESGIHNGVPIVASTYPVSWMLEPDDFEQGIWRIAWPNTRFILDLAGHGNSQPGTTIQLWERHPHQPCRLWRFVSPKPTSETKSLPEATPPVPVSPASTTADTIVNAEGLKLGGNGELTITTTTTTVTTTITKIAKLNCP